jgi:hypothetical protein
MYPHTKAVIGLDGNSHFIIEMPGNPVLPGTIGQQTHQSEEKK